MAKINITTKQGILIEQIDSEGYDLSKALARVSIHIDVQKALEKALEEDERMDALAKGDSTSVITSEGGS